MSQPKTSLLTPIYIKPRSDTAWPEDSVFYMLTGSGLFLCRNNQFYQSAVPAPRWPTELAKQESYLTVRYPKIPRRLMEYVVGYFDRVAKLHHSEAAVLLAWNRTKERMQIVVPDQVATVGRNFWGEVFPVGVEYEIPANLSPELAIMGDIHSHVDGAAYSSYVDKHDETYRPGLHVVVGRVNREPPEFHIEAVTDGTRFTVDTNVVLDGYRRRRTDVPDSWMDKITIEPYGQKYWRKDDDRQQEKDQLDKNDGYGDYSQSGAGAAGGGNGNGQGDRQKPVYEMGYYVADNDDDDDENDGDDRSGDQAVSEVDRKSGCPVHDEALVEETIHKEISDSLDDTVLEVEPETQQAPAAGADDEWKLRTDGVPKLGYEKAPACKCENDTKPKIHDEEDPQ